MRISTTTLESFRLFRQPEQDWMDEAELVATIKGEFRPTHAVLLGQAFGKVLETPDPYRVAGGYRCGEFAFGDDVMAPVLSEIDRAGVFEAKASKAYGPHTVVAKADHLLGLSLTEFKTTLSSFDVEKYASSCQWRFMADIFGARSVTYLVACLYEAVNGVIELRSVERVTFYPYPALPRDCAELVSDFAAYVTVRGLTPYLERAGTGLEVVA